MAGGEQLRQAASCEWRSAMVSHQKALILDLEHMTGSQTPECLSVQNNQQRKCHICHLACYMCITTCL